MITAKSVSTFLNLLVLFFLVVGRIGGEGLGLKIGGKIENLFPLLLIAWFLDRNSRPVPVSKILSPYLAGMFLAAAALMAGCVHNPSAESLEGLLRFSLQVGSGILLGIWLSANLKTNPWWTYLWIAGLVILQLGTPWGTLSHPEMEGSFGHRNLQSAFYLLSFPLMVFIFQTNQGSGRKERLIQTLCGLLLLSEVVFILVSRSRSGLAGILAALLIWLGAQGWLKTPHIPKTWGGYALAGIVFIALLMVSPRFLSLSREISDPFYLSRAGVWSAAIEGFQTPTKWLSGTGMGQGYFWTVQESPMGNLNYRYRRGHHPHCLYLQWIYWGGVSALMGWLFILAAISSQTFKKILQWEVLVLGACLLGYAFLEVFETAILNPRVNALFWLDLVLLGSIVSQSVGGEAQPAPNSLLKKNVTMDSRLRGNDRISEIPWKSSFPRRRESTVPTELRVFQRTVNNQWTSAWRIPAWAFILPMLWAALFNFPALLGLGFFLAAIAVLQWPRFQAWRETNSPEDLPLDSWRLTPLILGTLFLLGSYLPLVEALGLSSSVILAVMLLGFGAVLLERYSQPREVIPVASPPGFWSAYKLPTRICVGLSLGLPILLGGFVMVAFALGGNHISSLLKPKEGFFSILWLAFVWCALWIWMGRKSDPQHAPGRPFPLQLAAGTLIVLCGVLVFRVIGTGWSYLSCRGGTASVAEWDHLLKRSQEIGLAPMEWAIRRSALELARQEGDIETWVRWAKDAGGDPLKRSDPPSLLAEFLARGGRIIEDLGKEPRPKAVGLVVQEDLKTIWVLFDQGPLAEITDQTRLHPLDPETSTFTHLRLDPQGHPLILRADGELLRFDGVPVVLCPPPNHNTDPKFRRLCLDPHTGSPWTLDFYGNIHRFDPNSGWLQDSRFVDVSHHDDLSIDIARDLAITQDGTLALLDCYGQVWRSPINANTVEGPLSKTHYWPTLPLGQSILAVGNEFVLCDRYGGIYLTPYPKDPATLALRGTYLFPRSLPRKEQDITDQAFLAGRRWIYLLTSSGRILTNHRWGDVWAE